uniref:Uncharacterized protein n=1 Tax=Arundo donax TaxID=35708 RepID=A0A0A9BA59_ARUDO
MWCCRLDYHTSLNVVGLQWCFPKSNHKFQGYAPQAKKYRASR